MKNMVKKAPPKMIYGAGGGLGRLEKAGMSPPKGVKKLRSK